MIVIAGVAERWCKAARQNCRLSPRIVLNGDIHGQFLGEGAVATRAPLPDTTGGILSGRAVIFIVVHHVSPHVGQQNSDPASS